MKERPRPNETADVKIRAIPNNEIEIPNSDMCIDRSPPYNKQLKLLFSMIIIVNFYKPLTSPLNK